MSDMPPIDYSRLHTRRRARFSPKQMATLKDFARPLVGVICEWECFDYSSDPDDPFPGQYRWNVVRDDPHYAAFGGRWVPDEDLEQGGDDE